jgi:hypothetical protein
VVRVGDTDDLGAAAGDDLAACWDRLVCPDDLVTACLASFDRRG